jgi:hypothetical protein
MPILMKLNGERKQNIKSLLTTISLALALVTRAYAGIQWDFPDSTLSVPGTSFGTFGSGTATIHSGGFPGFDATWYSGSGVPWNMGPSVTGASGLWDLSKGGYIVLNSLSGSGLTTLNVFQWVDGQTYSGSITYSVNGGAAQSSWTSVKVGPDTALGAWWEYTANLGSALGGSDYVTITAPTTRRR